jgi:hypothetical protein
MTVIVGDGRGFNSLAAAPDGRAPAQCSARSWPVPVYPAEAVRFNATKPGCYHLLDCIASAVTADSFWRFSSVGLLWFFFADIPPFRRNDGGKGARRGAVVKFCLN